MSLSKGNISGSRFAIDIDGFSAGYLNNFQAPSYEAEDAGSSLGPDYVTKKMLGGPKIGEASGTFNVSQSVPLLDWAASLWLKTCKVVDTSVSLADQNYNVRRSVEMGSCLITAIEFPELKASDGKKALDITCKWKPSSLTFIEGGNKIASVAGSAAKSWLVHNFDVHPVFGLNTNAITCATLPKITAKTVNETYGEQRLGVQLYSSIEFSTIKLEIGGAGARAARDLAVKVIRDGNVDEGGFDDIIIDMKDQTLKKTLGTFELRGCMLKKFDWAPKLEGGKDGNAVSTLEFLCEDFRFSIAHK